MKYKLMAVDIDGTLVDSSGNLAEETVKAIRLAVSEGLVFSICTGRPVQGVEGLVERIGLDIPLITYNGAMVLTGKSREILYQQVMTEEDSRNIISLGEKYGTTLVIWQDNKLYAPKINERVLKYKEGANVEPILLSKEEMDILLKKGPTKILWYDDPEIISRYQDEVGSYLSPNVNYHTSKPIYLEFVDKRASKAIAMEKLGEYYGIKRNEMIAVGDGWNDLSMIEYAGLGIAMANAPAEIRDKAGFVTLSNDENGVAHAIYKFILREEK